MSFGSRLVSFALVLNDAILYMLLYPTMLSCCPLGLIRDDKYFLSRMNRVFVGEFIEIQIVFKRGRVKQNVRRV